MIVTDKYIEYPDVRVLILTQSRHGDVFHRPWPQMAIANLVLVVCAHDDSEFECVKNRWGDLERARSTLDQLFEEHEILDHRHIRIGQSDLVQMRLMASLG